MNATAEQKPRILMLGWELPPRITGGMGVACYGLGTALNRDHEVRWMLPQGWYEEQWVPQTEVRRTMRSLQTSGPYAGAAEIMHEVFVYTMQAIKTARLPDFDVVHAHDWLTWEAGAGIKSLTGKPLVMHVHSLAYDRDGKGFRQTAAFEIEKRCLAQADAVVAVSHYTAAALQAHYGVKPERIHVVHNALHIYRPDAEMLRQQYARKQQEQTGRPPLVTFSGRLTAQKNPLGFVRIAQQVAAAFPAARFAIAGTGDQVDEVREAVEAAGLTDRTLLLGFLERNDVYALLENTDVYVMPSQSEPFGIAALEAAVSGALCVLSRQAGVCEVMPAALAVDTWEESRMAEMVISALESPYRFTQTREACFYQAQQRCWMDAAEEMQRIYRSLESGVLNLE